jgi:hypothetical protein
MLEERELVADAAERWWLFLAFKLRGSRGEPR